MFLIENKREEISWSGLDPFLELENGFVRYAAAASEFEVVTNTVTTDLGGIQLGAGLRVRF